MQMVQVPFIRLSYPIRCPPPRLSETAQPWQDHPMSREAVNAICKSLPGAEVSDPFGGGNDTWKVGGKIFACLSVAQNGVSVKTDSVETAEMLIVAGVAARAAYFHRSWVTLAYDAGKDELRHRIETSYRLVRAGLTKKAQAALGPLP